MVDVVNKTCACGKQPSFGVPGGKPVCCVSCKGDGMVDVRSRTCACGVRPFFGNPGGKATCCASCKSPSMVDVVNKTCGCGKRPSFGVPGGRPTCCVRCKEDGMVDVVSRICLCGVQPFFGHPGGKAICCVSCKDSGMVDVRSKTCACGKQSVFGHVGSRPSCCVSCKESGMVDVVNKQAPCASCGLDHYSVDLREGVCYTCTRAKGRIEHVMRAHLKAAFPDAFWLFDKTPAGVLACSDRRYRPDCWLEEDDKVIVVECDEGQHENYDASCDLRRTVELIAACESKPLVIIRWNPGQFRVDGKIRKVSEQKRLERLEEEVKKALREVPGRLIEERYLFFDDVREEKLRGLLEDAMGAYIAAGV